MPRLYLARVVGDGTPVTNRFEVKAVRLLAGMPEGTRVKTLAIPTDVQGRPFRNWALCEIFAASFAVFDSDGDLAALADRVALDTVPNGGQRNRINNLLGQLGVTTTADAGESFRVIANQLLTELGTQVRV